MPYAYLSERGVDPELAEVRVLLKTADRLHRFERHLPDARGPAVGCVLQARRSLLDPPLEDPVDGGGAYAQVAGDRLRAPAIRVQRDHGRPTVPALGDLVVGREAAHEPQGYGLLLEDAPDRLVVRTPSEADVDGVGYLVEVEAGVLGLQIHGEPADRRRQLLPSGVLGAE